MQLDLVSNVCCLLNEYHLSFYREFFLMSTNILPILTLSNLYSLFLLTRILSNSSFSPLAPSLARFSGCPSFRLSIRQVNQYLYRFAPHLNRSPTRRQLHISLTKRNIRSFQPPSLTPSSQCTPSARISLVH